MQNIILKLAEPSHRRFKEFIRGDSVAALSLHVNGDGFRKASEVHGKDSGKIKLAF